MTGEMVSIQPDGTDSDGNVWEPHAYVAQKTGRQLRPFDQYIGPYIDCKEGMLFFGSDDGETATAVLWPDGDAPAYRKPMESEPFLLYAPDTNRRALAATREVLREYRRQRRAA